MLGETTDFSRYPRAHPCTGRLHGLLGCVCLLVVGAAHADNPGYDRPGLGFTPIVLAPGQLTWEQGVLDGSLDRQDGQLVTQGSADTLLRLGIGGPFELQFGGAPYSYQRIGNERSTGHADSTLGIKFAPPAHGPASWGLLASVEFNDGTRGLRADTRQYLAGAQLNLQLSQRQALGLYLEDVRAGGDDRLTAALGDSWALNSGLSLYGETAWLHVPGRGDGSEAGAGVAWQATPRVQLDLGLDRRLAGVAPRWQVNAGVSIYFGR